MTTPVYLNALRAFEASARHQSFSEAAKELSVTPAAVGQLVKTLETWLGTPLFVRGSSGRARLVATEAAEHALPDIRAGFARLRAGIDLLKESSSHGVLTVTVSPAFAAKWLLPRIERFQAACPDLDLRLDTSLKPVDFVARKIDAGVRYGAGGWPGLQADRLMGEEIYPVCSPRLQRELRLRTADDLQRATLIHDLSMDGQAGFPMWNDWFRAAGISSAETARGMQINNSAAVLQAAADSHGVALARSVMTYDDLTSGRLVRLFPSVTLASPFSYFIVCRQGSGILPRIEAFKRWILTEASAFDDRTKLSSVANGHF